MLMVGTGFLVVFSLPLGATLFCNFTHLHLLRHFVRLFPNLEATHTFCFAPGKSFAVAWSHCC